MNGFTEYRELAASWHGGQMSPLYTLASSGTPIPGLAREARACAKIADDEDRAALIELATLADALETIGDALVLLFSFGVDQ